MNNHTIEIKADNQPTVLERLLQVTRYRGFVVTNFTVLAATEDNLLDIKLTVNDPKGSTTTPEAGIQRLYNQLDKLFDIKQVNLLESKSVQCQA